MTEYMLVFQKQDVFLIPFSLTLSDICDLQKKDVKVLTWHHLIRMTLESRGGTATLTELYGLLENHPKAKVNPHYKERIRATIYEHKDQYVPNGNGQYSLSYQVA